MGSFSIVSRVDFSLSKMFQYPRKRVDSVIVRHKRLEKFMVMRVQRFIYIRAKATSLGMDFLVVHLN